ncbi:MAG: hypothetical protein ABI700_29815 [Chloroflexota bacterium]
MGYWGWRPLVFGLFISTWVVGCNIVTDNNAPSAAPSAYPRVTLTVGRLPTAQVSAAPTRAAPTRMLTPQPSESVSPVPSLQLLVQPPTCYETHPGNLLCLGQVENPFPFPVEHVALEVRLLQADGSVYRSERSTLEQTAIQSNSFAPYQAAFEADETEFATADADLVSAETGVQDRFVMLLIEDVKGQAIDGQRVVSAVIYNPGPQNAELLRAFVTLLDNLGRVIGYRVVTFDSGTILPAGAHMPLEIEVTPQISDATPDYILYVEARALEN